MNNVPLLKKISSKKKPIFLSTGASNLKEIKSAVKLLNEYKVLEEILEKGNEINKNITFRRFIIDFENFLFFS